VDDSLTGWNIKHIWDLQTKYIFPDPWGRSLIERSIYCKRINTMARSLEYPAFFLKFVLAAIEYVMAIDALAALQPHLHTKEMV